MFNTPQILYQVKSYKLTDMPIVLEGDSSAVELNDFAGPRSPESEHERHLGFDERIPLSLSLPDASGRVESDDGSDSDTTKHFTFRKRKRGLEVGGLLSNVPLSSHPQEDNRVTDRESQRVEGDRGRRKRRRHNDRDRAVERDDHSLSGVLTGGDSGDAEGIRGVRRQMGLTPRRRNANDTSDLASKRKRRHRSVSSSSSSSRHRRLRHRRLTNRSGTAGLLRLRRTLHGRCLNPPVVADSADSISFRARRQKILLRTERKVTVMTILSLPTDRADPIQGLRGPLRNSKRRKGWPGRIRMAPTSVQTMARTDLKMKLCGNMDLF